jgi:hypothetical protein
VNARTNVRTAPASVGVSSSTKLSVSGPTRTVRPAVPSAGSAPVPAALGELLLEELVAAGAPRLGGPTGAGRRQQRAGPPHRRCSPKPRYLIGRRLGRCVELPSERPGSTPWLPKVTVTVSMMT